MTTAGDLSGIEAAVMHAATDPDAWQGVTQAVTDAFPGSRPNLLDYDLTRGEAVTAHQTGCDDTYLRSYHAHYRTVVPGFLTWADFPVGRVACLTELMPEQDLLRSEFWNDWLRPQDDLRQSALTVLHKDGGRRFLFGVPVERWAVDRVMAPLTRAMRHLHPLMRHALAINRMLLGLRLDAALLRLGVEPSDAAVLLLSRRGVLLYANARAERMLTEGALIRYDGVGRVSFADPTGMMRLQAALRPSSALKGMAFRLGSMVREQEVRLMPLLPEAVARLGIPFLTEASRPGLLMAMRSRRQVEDKAKRVATQLGLTRAEATVALALVEGATVAEIADARGVSIHTVRNQIRLALSKAGVHRQVDLARLIQGLPRPN